MNKLWIIARDVYRKNVKSISFVVMILTPFLMMGLIYGIGYLSAGGFSGNDIAVVSDNPAIAQQFKEYKSDDMKFKVADSEKAAKKQLQDEDIDGFLKITMTDSQVEGTLYSNSGLGTTTEMTISQLLNGIQGSLNAGNLGLNAEQVASLSTPAKFEKAKVKFTDSGKMEEGKDDSGVRMVMTMAVVIIMFIVGTLYSSIIAQEVASEKGTRIMEVILSSTTAQTHFYGKLLGVLMVLVTQVLIYIVAFLVALPKLSDLDIVKQLLVDIDLQDLFGSFFIYSMLFLLVGVFLVCVLAAICGSLVSKAEDTAKAVQPVTYLGLIGYFIGLSLGMGDPQNIVVRVTSYIPFLSTYIMPVRMASDTVNNAGILISLGITIVFTILLTLISARLYKSNVLIYSEGGMISSLKQSFSIMKNERSKA